MISKNKKYHNPTRMNPFYKRSGLYVISIIVLFVSIGISTPSRAGYRFSCDTISEWTSDIESSTFLYLMGMENSAYKKAFPEDKALPNLSTSCFQIASNIK